MRTDLKVLLLGLAALIIFFIYSFSPITIGEDKFELKKADFLSLASPVALADSTLLAATDTVMIVEEEKRLVPDTTPRKILFFGDSMVDYLGRPFESYAAKNGHEIESVVWFSSSTELWAKTDTLQYFMREYNPDYIVICLGSNELYYKDADRRREWVKEIQAKIGDIPYFWISPPNWVEKYVFNDMVRETVGEDRYFDSSHLSLKRGPDHKHPTYDAAIGWMDTVARWMQSDKNRHPIVMEKPDEKVRVKHLHMLKPCSLSDIKKKKSSDTKK